MAGGAEGGDEPGEAQAIYYFLFPQGQRHVYSAAFIPAFLRGAGVSIMVGFRP
jgi:hypothetical protein